MSSQSEIGFLDIGSFIGGVETCTACGFEVAGRT
jgi:hypothetical protein